MSGLDAHRRVAGLLGISTNHVDAFGNPHEADEATLSRLIAAFGLPADPQQAAAALDEERNAAPFGLAPVHILDQDDPGPVLPLPRPPQRGPRNGIEWHIRLEDGGERRGRGEEDALRLPSGLPLGYHRLAVAAGRTKAEIDLIVAPRSCHLPEGLRGGARSWGLTAQLYGLRGERDWGIGDFTELEQLCRRAGSLGAAAIGVNPLHALFASEPRHFSPYSPSSRVWLNYLYIDVTAVPGFAEDEAAQALAPRRRLPRRAMPILSIMPRSQPSSARFWKRCSGASAATKWDREGRSPRISNASVRQAGALWPILRFSRRCTSISGGKAVNFPGSRGRRRCATRARPRSPSLPGSMQAASCSSSSCNGLPIASSSTRRRAGGQSGLAIGLYRDLAIGANPHGAEAWADSELVIGGAAIGAPPDPLSRSGQNWGLAPLNPLVLRRRGFAPLIAAIRANMRHAGVLRIDHVMGLCRLYWIPSGGPATAGAYVEYPFEEVLRLVALESRRHRCAVVGEDLGTVPPGFRETMQAANVLSYRIFAFERREDGSFIAPGEYPPSPPRRPLPMIWRP